MVSPFYYFFSRLLSYNYISMQFQGVLKGALETFFFQVLLKTEYKFKL